MADTRAFAATLFDRTALAGRYGRVTIKYTVFGVAAVTRFANFQPTRSEDVQGNDGLDDVETAELRISKDPTLGIAAPTVNDSLVITTPSLGTWEVINLPEDIGPSWKLTITKITNRHRGREGYRQARSRG